MTRVRPRICKSSCCCFATSWCWPRMLSISCLCHQARSSSQKCDIEIDWKNAFLEIPILVFQKLGPNMAPTCLWFSLQVSNTLLSNISVLKPWQSFIRSYQPSLSILKSRRKYTFNQGFTSKCLKLDHRIIYKFQICWTLKKKKLLHTRLCIQYLT